MESIQAIYDGFTFKPLESIPVSGQYEVKIIFEKQIEKQGSANRRTWDEKVIAFQAVCERIATTVVENEIEIDLDTERMERINRRK